jgi:D-amino peptidase
MKDGEELKIYIMADMEGASGIACREQTDSNHFRYKEGRRLLTCDVNAAIRGAFEGGASEVYVADAHSSSFNLLPEELDPRARLIVGVPHRSPRIACLDGSFAGVFLVAYHAMAGTLNAVLEHTMNSRKWHSIRINGVPCGEVEIDAAVAAAVGVPTVLITGDDKVCEESRSFLGDIETVSVKEGLGRHHANCLSPKMAAQKIEDGARKAVERLANGESFKKLTFDTPVTVSITYKHTEDADVAAANIFSRRIDGYTVEETYDSFTDWLGGL